jgi:hypothetical protein
VEIELVKNPLPSMENKDSESEDDEDDSRDHNHQLTAPTTDPETELPDQVVVQANLDVQQSTHTRHAPVADNDPHYERMSYGPKRFSAPVGEVSANLVNA